MILINFGHPVSPEVLGEIAKITGPIQKQQTIRCQVSNEQFFDTQAQSLVDQIDLSPEEWQRVRFCVILPGLSTIAAAVLAHMHGRCGYWPAVVRLKPVQDSVPPKFVFAEVMNLDGMRQTARQLR